MLCRTPYSTYRSGAIEVPKAPERKRPPPPQRVIKNAQKMPVNTDRDDDAEDDDRGTAKRRKLVVWRYCIVAKATFAKD